MRYRTREKQLALYAHWVGRVAQSEGADAEWAAHVLAWLQAQRARRIEAPDVDMSAPWRGYA